MKKEGSNQSKKRSRREAEEMWEGDVPMIGNLMKGPAKKLRYEEPMSEGENSAIHFNKHR